MQADSRPQLRLEKTMEQRLPLPFKTFNEQIKDQKRLSYLESSGFCTVRAKENEEQVTQSAADTAAPVATWESEENIPIEDVQQAAQMDTNIAGDGEKNAVSAVGETDILASLKQNADVPEYTILGEAFNCYVIVQLEDRILLIDKHAAHERILFDELCKRMDAKEKHAQILMFPLKLKLVDEELLALEEYKEDIKATGFQIQIKKRPGEVIISEIPEEIGRDSASDMIAELAAGLSDGTGSVEATKRKFFEAKLFSASCKAAIKGGRVYGEQHLRWICNHLLQTPDKEGSAVKTCPHGRPVAFEITKNSLESQFERIT